MTDREALALIKQIVDKGFEDNCAVKVEPGSFETIAFIGFGVIDDIESVLNDMGLFEEA